MADVGRQILTNKYKIMDIENTLKEVGNYFKRKLIEGDYKFLKCNDCRAEILFDGKYKFDVWIANKPEDNFDFYDNNFMNENAKGFMQLTTQKDRITAYRKIKPFVIKCQEGKLKREKMKQFEKLKRELAIE